MKKKILALTLVFALALALGIGGTVAWLTAKTDSVVNTFTVGDINITLTESENLNLKMVPGNDITKDPKVTVLKDSEACWLFVKIDETNDVTTYIDYAVADGWTAGEGTGYKDDGSPKNGVPVGVYYRDVSATTNDTAYSVLKSDKVTVKDTVTKEQMNALRTQNQDGTFTYDKANLPKLTFTAYAVQKDNIATAAEAWAKVSTTSNP